MFLIQKGLKKNFRINIYIMSESKTTDYLLQIPEDDELLSLVNTNKWTGTYYERVCMKRLVAARECIRLMKKGEKECSSTKSKSLKGVIDFIVDNVRKINNKWYLPVKFKSKMCYGRITAKRGYSFGGLWRPLRHFCSVNIYFDFDVINSNSIIANYLMVLFGISNKFMKNYIDKREMWLREIQEGLGITREKAKKLILTILNAGDLTYHLEKYQNKTKEITEKLESLNCEIEKLHKKMKKSKLGKDIMKRIKCFPDRKSKAQRLKCMYSYYFQTYENIALQFLKQKAIDHLNINNKDTEDGLDYYFMASHDGAQIEKKYFKEITPETFLNILNKDVKEYTGIDFQYKLKPFDEAYKVKEILDKAKIDYEKEYKDPFYEKYGIQRYDDIDVHRIDDELARIFCFSEKKNWVTCKTPEKSLVIMKRNTKTGLWSQTGNTETNESNNEELSNYVKEQLTWFADKYKDRYSNIEDKLLIELKISGVKMNKELLKLFKESSKRLRGNPIENKIFNTQGRNQVLAAIKNRLVNNSFSQKLDKKPDLLGFINGLLDLGAINNHIKKSKWEDLNLDKDNFDWILQFFRTIKDDDFLSQSCGYNFDINKKVWKKYEEYKKILLTIFGEKNVMYFVLEILSLNMDSYKNKHNKMLYLFGDGGNGKSFIGTLLGIVFGNYCEVCKGINFTKTAQRTVNVEMATWGKKHFGVISEPPTEWDSEMFKGLTGNDGEGYKTRNNHAKNMVHVMLPILLCLANGSKKPKFLGEIDSAIKRRVIALNLLCYFGDIGDGEYDKNNKNHFIKNVNLTDEIRQNNESKMAFMIIMLQAYIRRRKNPTQQPQRITDDTNDYLNLLNKLKSWIFDNFEIDNQKKTRISVKQAYEHMKKKYTKDGFDLDYDRFQSQMIEYGFKMNGNKDQRAQDMKKLNSSYGKTRNTQITNCVFIGDDTTLYESYSDGEEEEKEEEKIKTKEKKDKFCRKCDKLYVKGCEPLEEICSCKEPEPYEKSPFTFTTGGKVHNIYMSK